MPSSSRPLSVRPPARSDRATGKAPIPTECGPCRFRLTMKSGRFDGPPRLDINQPDNLFAAGPCLYSDGLRAALDEEAPTHDPIGGLLRQHLTGYFGWHSPAARRIATAAGQDGPPYPPAETPCVYDQNNRAIAEARGLVRSVFPWWLRDGGMNAVGIVTSLGIPTDPDTRWRENSTAVYLIAENVGL